MYWMQWMIPKIVSVAWDGLLMIGVVVDLMASVCPFCLSSHEIALFTLVRCVPIIITKLLGVFG
jgi:hypothetical protein